MLNKLNEHLLDAPNLKSEWCCVCGAPAMNDHHVIIKGMGGTKLEKRIPTVSLCGWGNTGGCHGRAHAGRLHFDYRDGRWLCLEEEDGISYAEALKSDKWRECYGQEPA